MLAAIVGRAFLAISLPSTNDTISLSDRSKIPSVPSASLLISMMVVVAHPLIKRLRSPTMTPFMLALRMTSSMQ